MAALKTKEKIITYIFKNSEKLTLAVNCLYANRSTRFLKSNLYVLSKRYYLTIVSKYDKSIEKIGEFPDGSSTATVIIPILNEYGKLLIKGSAIRTYGKAFAKYF